MEELDEQQGPDCEGRFEQQAIFGNVEPVLSDQTRTGDDCIFFYGEMNSELQFNNRAESPEGLESRSGTFGNSVFLSNSQYRDVWFGDWRKRDFRFHTDTDGTDAGGTAHNGRLPDATNPSRGVQQKHWDWENEQAVSEA